MKAQLLHFTDKLTHTDLFISGFELSQEAKALALTAHIAENLMAIIPSDDALFLAQELINRSSMEIKSIYSDPEETGKPPHFNFENGIVFEFDGFCAITIQQHIFYVIAETQKIYDLLYSHFKKEVQEWADQAKEDENNFDEKDNRFKAGE